MLLFSAQLAMGYEPLLSFEGPERAARSLAQSELVVVGKIQSATRSPNTEFTQAYLTYLEENQPDVFGGGRGYKTWDSQLLVVEVTEVIADNTGSKVSTGTQLNVYLEAAIAPTHAHVGVEAILFLDTYVGSSGEVVAPYTESNSFVAPTHRDSEAVFVRGATNAAEPCDGALMYRGRRYLVEFGDSASKVPTGLETFRSGSDYLLVAPSLRQEAPDCSLVPSWMDAISAVTDFVAGEK